MESGLEINQIQFTQNYGVTARKDPELSDFINLRWSNTEATPHAVYLGREDKDLLCVYIPSQASLHLRFSLSIGKICTDYCFHKLCLNTYLQKIVYRFIF